MSFIKNALKIIFFLPIVLLIFAYYNGKQIYTAEENIAENFFSENEPEFVGLEHKIIFGSECRGYFDISLFNYSALFVYDPERQFLSETAGGTFTTDDGVAILIIGAKDINIMSHEVAHAVYFLMKKRGIRDPETQAYLQGYMTEVLFKFSERFAEDETCLRI